jgi:3-hydroxyisobutyrate dehydrogenase-like beta-hydroxyacid dehydrogenase
MKLAFIGLGVMGEPMCRNLAQKSGVRVSGFDRDRAPLARLADAGVHAAHSVAEAMSDAQVVFLSLPSGEIVEALAHEPDGLLACTVERQIVVDTGTSSVDMTRALAQAFDARGAIFVDAPVARTRAAAEAGSLSVMVGAGDEVFDRIRPLLACFAVDITHCGGIGCGQVVKIMNNMVLFETVAALAEAKAIASRAGVDPRVLFETLSRGSADSFALRNHGMNAMLPGEFPVRAFSVDYARKDLRYALILAEETGVEAAGARLVDAYFERAKRAGFSERYWPVIDHVIDPLGDDSGATQLKAGAGV